MLNQAFRGKGSSCQQIILQRCRKIRVFTYMKYLSFILCVYINTYKFTYIYIYINNFL